MQISSLPTEISRVYKTKQWKLFDADVVIVDESHIQSSGENLEILKAFKENGATIIGVTATPIEVSHFYPHLIVAATNSELRACGAHVPVICKNPNEFDLREVRRVKTGEYYIGDIRKHVWSQAIVGNVIDHWVEYNPNKKMTLLFAPGVPEAVSIAQDFEARGFKAASIDANSVWVDGNEYKDTPDGSIREEVLKRWKDGDIHVLCNRFVLREGIDYPSLAHEILATPMGSLKSFLQATGRVIRKSPETPDQVLLTDHGGSVNRMGSPNEDRDWHSLYWMTDREIVEQRRREMQKNPQKDPITCPFCGTVRRHGMSACPPPPYGCGKASNKRVRRIIQSNGRLVEVSGPIVRPDTTRTKQAGSKDQERWDRIFWSSRRSTSNRAMNFRQARAMFIRKYKYFPEGLVRVPEGDPATGLNWGRKVREVDMKDLKGPANENSRG